MKMTVEGDNRTIIIMTPGQESPTCIGFVTDFVRPMMLAMQYNEKNINEALGFED